MLKDYLVYLKQNRSSNQKKKHFIMTTKKNKKKIYKVNSKRYIGIYNIYICVYNTYQIIIEE